MAAEAKQVQVTKPMVIVNAIDMMKLQWNGLTALLSKTAILTLMLF
jgi:hypothetical protein